MKTAIVYLVKNESRHVHNLQESLDYLDNYWEFPKRPPVIVFHEGLPESIGLEMEMGYWPWGEIYPAKVKFEIPSWVDGRRVPENHFGSIGYRHMCRFFAGEFLRHPTLQDIDYVWRLDTDSFLTRTLPYNPFEKLVEQGANYGYLTSFQDIPEVTEGLWDATKRFAEAKKILSEIAWDRHLYYTNFEILDLNFFRSVNFGYLDFFDFLDHEGGIYYKRWGDHVIRHLGIQLFKGKAYKFENIGYRHQHFQT